MIKAAAAAVVSNNPGDSGIFHSKENFYFNRTGPYCERRQIN